MTAGFARARTLRETLDLLGQAAGPGRPVLLAGGTDWMVERHHAPPHPPPAPAVIDITGVGELSAVSESRLPDGTTHFRLGAGVTYGALRRHPGLLREAPILAAMAREVGAVQIQERGTLGGNLATGSPAADGVPVLFALAATLHLMNAAGSVRDVPVDAFYTGYRRNVLAPDEMIVAIGFDAPRSARRWYWRKVGTRRAQAISKVALAATARLDGGRVRDARFGMASVAPVIAGLPAVRAELLGREPGALRWETLRAALHRDIAPIDDVRSTREYRRHVAERLLERFVETLRA